jgi:hypothetical protein
VTHEPFARVLARNVAIALGVGVVAALARRNALLVLEVGALALWFSLGGHFVEVLFLSQARPRMPHLARPRQVARLLTWFVGGALLFTLMTGSARLLALRWLSFEAWWIGALAFVAIELFVHALLALSGRPNFYRGDG